MAKPLVRPAEMEPPPETVPTPVPPKRERRLPYGILWIVFLVCMFVGAGLVVAEQTVLGIIFLGIPLGGALLLTAAYYLLQRGGKGGSE